MRTFLHTSRGEITKTFANTVLAKEIIKKKKREVRLSLLRLQRNYRTKEENKKNQLI